MRRLLNTAFVVEIPSEYRRCSLKGGNHNSRRRTEKGLRRAGRPAGGRPAGGERSITADRRPGVRRTPEMATNHATAHVRPRTT